MPAIEVIDLVRRYGKLTAVAGISFEVHQGEIFGFLGPNGAGKTTTIHILCTLLKPTSGKALINGFDVVKQRSQVRHSIGLVFQDPSLDEYLTAEENLEFHAMAYGVPTALRRERIASVMNLIELWEKRKSQVRNFSGGMKRRLELARALLHYPRVLFLDEPTLGLDPQTREHTWNYITELRHKQEITIFMTTHYMDEAEHCDRIAIIDHGQIVAMDTPENLKSLVGGDIITLQAENMEKATLELQERYRLTPVLQNGYLQFEVEKGDEFIPEFVHHFGKGIRSVSLRRPTLDDVFLKVTGRALRDEGADSSSHLGVPPSWRSRR